MAGSKGIVSNQFYTFSAANRTITFTNDYAGLDLGEISYITNIKNGVATVIYDPFDATKGGTLSGLTLTLVYNTTAMADTDPLQVIVGMTPQNADPQLVKVVPDVNNNNQTDLLQNISDNLDFLNLALDQSEGIQMNIRDSITKKDASGANVLSDAPTPIPIYLRGDVANNISAIIDTAGYVSTSITVRTPATWNAQFVIEGSNDGVAYFIIPITYTFVGGSGFQVAGNITFSTNADAALHISNIFRYIRLRISSIGAGGSLALTGTAFLRQYPITPGNPSLNLPINIASSGVTLNTNISQINSVAPLANQINTNAAQIGNSGGIGITGFYPHAFNTSLGTTQINTQTPYPIGVGGLEKPYVGQLNGIFRYITVDANGRYQLAGDTAFRTPNMGGVLEQSQAGTTRGIGGVLNNIQGAQSLTVSDTNQSEGDTDNMLLKQILQELKILNQQLTEIPFLMNAGQSQMSDPQEYRDDKSILF